MKVGCAWCGKDLGEKEPYDDKETTHGMCENCSQKMTNEIPCGVCGARDWWYRESGQEGRPGEWLCGRCHPDPNK